MIMDSNWAWSRHAGRALCNTIGNGTTDSMSPINTIGRSAGEAKKLYCSDKRTRRAVPIFTIQGQCSDVTHSIRANQSVNLSMEQSIPVNLAGNLYPFGLEARPKLCKANITEQVNWPALFTFTCSTSSPWPRFQVMLALAPWNHKLKTWKSKEKPVTQ